MKFISMLVGVLESIIKTVLSPVIEQLFKTLWGEFLVAALEYLYKRIVYRVFQLVLFIVDAIESFFNVFTGLEDITVVQNGQSQHMPLIDYLMSGSTLTKVFIYITFFAAALGFLFATFAAARSIAETAMGDERYPISKVLRSGLKSAFGFAWVPFFCLLIQKLTSVIIAGLLQGLNGGLNASNKNSMADIMFLAVSQDALKSGMKEEAYRYASDTQYFYRDINRVVQYYDIQKIHYFYGFLLTIPVMVILLLSCVQFIRRIFDLMVLYVAAPFFTSSIVLDDGARFKKWRELFIGKYFASYAVVVIMRLFLLLVPIIANDIGGGNDWLTFSEDRLLNLTAFIIFVVGGAWSAYKAQSTIIRMIAPDSVARSVMGDQMALYRAAQEVGKVAEAYATGGTSAAAEGAKKAGQAASGALQGAGDSGGGNEGQSGG